VVEAEALEEIKGQDARKRSVQVCGVSLQMGDKKEKLVKAVLKNDGSPSSIKGGANS